jgi:hypothetical protein
MRNLTFIVFIAMVMSYIIAAMVGCQSVQVITPPVVKPSGVALAWGHPEWSDALFIMVNDHLPEFDKAQDATRFCPTYAKLSSTDKIVMWSSLIVAVSKYESDYNPKSVYHEPPPLSVDSIGLLQLSYGDKFCPKSKAEGDLQDPYINLQCGVKIMASLIAQDSIVQNSAKRGAARYWSVLRDGHHPNDIAKIVNSISVCH